MGAQTQRKATSQHGHPNARRAVTKRTRSLAKVGRPRARQGELARGAPKCNARPVGKMGAQTHEEPQRNARTAVRKRTKSRNENDHTKGALGKKTSRRTDKNQFWLGGRFFNTASPRLGARTQRKASSQDVRPNATQGKASWQEGHPNAMQGQLARWAPKRTKSRNGTHERP
jgi:hypothetical protein